MDTTIQKDGIPGFSGCLEYTSTKSNQPRVRREIYTSSSLISVMHLGQYHIVSSGLLSTSPKYQSPSNIWLKPTSKICNSASQHQILPTYCMVSKWASWLAAGRWQVTKVGGLISTNQVLDGRHDNPDHNITWAGMKINPSKSESIRS